jgi:hypothetical protein
MDSVEYLEHLEVALRTIRMALVNGNIRVALEVVNEELEKLESERKAYLAQFDNLPQGD